MTSEANIMLDGFLTEHQQFKLIIEHNVLNVNQRFHL